ncbi:MAG: two-component system, OmpR family, operon response regulator KdpE [Pseudonocardiales bacterium]|nr:two-component system, OmpR family, operon response regulator KdpE [Pseudonocardiales bacterium]
MTHVLVVDDEPQLLRTLVLTLTQRGFQVSTAADGTTALRIAKTETPDLVLLDLGLPDIDGLEAIRRLRRDDPGLPIIVLSARSGSNDKIVALDLGASDYMTKPFDINELLAHLRAVARRKATPRARTSVPVHFGQVSIDLYARLVVKTDEHGKETIHLTPTEWRLLEMLLDKPGALISSRELLIALRGDADNTESSYLRIYMAQLRRKLEPEPGRPRYLLTEPGMGYRYQPHAAVSEGTAEDLTAEGGE